jgi:hypothetical protein
LKEFTVGEHVFACERITFHLQFHLSSQEQLQSARDGEVAREGKVDSVRIIGTRRAAAVLFGSPYVRVTSFRCGLLNLRISLAANEDSRTSEI